MVSFKETELQVGGISREEETIQCMTSHFYILFTVKLIRYLSHAPEVGGCSRQFLK